VSATDDSDWWLDMDIAQRLAAIRKERSLVWQVVAKRLLVSLDELFGSRAKAPRALGDKCGPAPQWQQQIEAVSQLPLSQQQFVAGVINMALAQASTRAAAR
jgi:hypothetical protein